MRNLAFIPLGALLISSCGASDNQPSIAEAYECLNYAKYVYRPALTEDRVEWVDEQHDYWAQHLLIESEKQSLEQRLQVQADAVAAFSGKKSDLKKEARNEVFIPQIERCANAFRIELSP